MGTVQLDKRRAGFDKWQMYRLVRDENIGPCLVPKTVPLTGQTLKIYLDEFHRVYVKPTGTWGGVGISLVERNQMGIFWTLQGKPTKSSNLDEILHHYEGISAIVQQAIPALQYHGFPFDIRVQMQRDVSESWVYAGELVRVGGVGIVSNVKISNGGVLPLSSVWTGLFAKQGLEFEVLQRHLAEVGHRICKLLDPYSSIQEVGIDLALDGSQRLWLIEVNTNDAFGAPSHELFRQLPNQSIYHDMQQRANLRNLSTVKMLFEMFAEKPDDGRN